jgi:hypothetical protein
MYYLERLNYKIHWLDLPVSAWKLPWQQNFNSFWPHDAKASQDVIGSHTNKGLVRDVKIKGLILIYKKSTHAKLELEEGLEINSVQGEIVSGGA